MWFAIMLTCQAAVCDGSTLLEMRVAAARQYNTLAACEAAISAEDFKARAAALGFAPEARCEQRVKARMPSGG